MNSLKVIAAMLCIATFGLTTSCDKDNEDDSSVENNETNTGKHLVKRTVVDVEETWINNNSNAGEDGYTDEFVWSGNHLVKWKDGRYGVEVYFNYTGDNVISASDGQGSVEFTYEENMLTKMIDGNNVTTVQYDETGSIAYITRVNNDDDNPTPHPISFTWDNGNLTGVTRQGDDYEMHTTYYEYDTKACAFVGFPLAYFMVNDFGRGRTSGFGRSNVTPFVSKNNPTSCSDAGRYGYVYQYEGDYPISAISNKYTQTDFDGYDSIVFYTITYFEYDDGTGRRD